MVDSVDPIFDDGASASQRGSARVLAVFHLLTAIAAAGAIGFFVYAVHHLDRYRVSFGHRAFRTDSAWDWALFAFILAGGAVSSLAHLAVYWWLARNERRRRVLLIALLTAATNPLLSAATLFVVLRPVLARLVRLVRGMPG